jgi:hypothetical protein
MKKRIAELLVLLYNELNEKTLVDRQLKIRAENFLTWAATELDDNGANIKYLGQQYWSESALAKYIKNGRKNNGLRHEHVVPRKILREMINELPTKDFDNIFKILKTYAISCIITVEEDKILGKIADRNVYKTNIWCRYINNDGSFKFNVIDVSKVDKEVLNIQN